MFRGLCEPFIVKSIKDGTHAQVALADPPLVYSLESRITIDTGYVTVLTNRGTMSEHRAVMSQMLGRRLVEHENVHHVNGDRADNRPANLELWRVSQPAGQRVSDLVAYVAEFHSDKVISLIEYAKRKAA